MPIRTIDFINKASKEFFDESSERLKKEDYSSSYERNFYYYALTRYPLDSALNYKQEITVNDNTIISKYNQYHETREK
jgi:hypothetical protein